MSTIAEIEDEIRDEFAMFDDWEDRYNYLIDLGKDLPLIDASLKTDGRIIKGCQSRVWLNAESNDGKIVYTADSDAIITKGLVGLMISVLSDQPAKEIAAADIYFIDKIGLKSHLSPTRSNGLLAMLKQMKLYALAFSSVQPS